MKTRKQVILNLEEDLAGLRYRELAIEALVEANEVSRFNAEILEQKERENDVEMMILQKTIELLKSEEGA